jgi:putative endonuclease
MDPGDNTGRDAEQAACDYLRQQGLALVTANYRCARGEIDLIMRHRDTTVFVEVRLRRSSRFGSGAESVDRRKQDKLLAAAAHYLQQHPRAARGACRFDVVAFSTDNGRQRLDWIADAFQAPPGN